MDGPFCIGDRLRVLVWKSPQQVELLVDERGYATHPKLGKLAVAGVQYRTIARRIAERLSEPERKLGADEIAIRLVSRTSPELKIVPNHWVLK